jgi:hypothetical protein
MQTIAGHVARFDRQGRLETWAAWNEVIDREMSFYQQCPLEHGYPRFVLATFLDGSWVPMPDRTDSIPATQNGMGILSYLKYQAWRGGGDQRFLNTARAMGDYLVAETLTPAGGRFPAFTRSTGKRDQFPLNEDCGSQSDRPHETQPDKGGIAATQTEGDEGRSPWPFRVDWRDGTGRGPVSGNMTYVLRLYDELLAQGHEEFSAPRRELWHWIKRRQIPSAAADGALFAQFFEDHDTPTNRTAWAPLNLARYLLEKRELLDAEWRKDAGTLIEFVRRTFTHAEFGVTVCHEQDEDQQAWGGINSTYGAVLAVYAEAAGLPALADEARRALNFTLYSVDEAGRPRDLSKNPAPGGWQEDAHTDVIHNYVDVLRAFPEWGDAPA